MNSQNQNSNRMTIVRSGLKRPSWICQNVRQNVILIRDRSASMYGQKVKDASAASLDLVSELAQPSNKDGFSVAVIDFAGNAKVVHQLETASKLDGSIKPLLDKNLGGCTNVTDGLKKALAILRKEESRQDEKVSYLRPVVLLFTDGEHNHGAAPNSIAGEVKERADLVTVAFGGDADEKLLRVLASTPQHFYRCKTGRDLRGFLAAVGATMTATMAAGSNATHALTMVQK